LKTGIAEKITARTWEVRVSNGRWPVWSCGVGMWLVLVGPGVLRAQAWSWPDRAENLQVLPEDFPATRLRAVMTGFTRALGVRCSYCHVGREGEPLSSYDFVSDDNANKERARAMLRMLDDVNRALETIEPSGDARVNMWCHTCHRGRPRPMTLAEELEEVYRGEGSAAALERYGALRERFYGRGSYDFGEGSLNTFGYAVLAAGDADGAVRVFALNAELFPGSGNVWDSLAEAHMSRGDTEEAIRFYEKALQLDPENENARQRLAALRSGRS